MFLYGRSYYHGFCWTCSHTVVTVLLTVVCPFFVLLTEQPSEYCSLFLLFSLLFARVSATYATT